MRRTTRTLLISVFGLWASAAAAAQGNTQEGPAQGSRVEIGGSLGYTNFVDDSALHHCVAGASARIRIVRGLGFAPELTYMYRSRQDRDFILMPNLVWEFRRGKKVVPYVIGGVGILNHRESWDHFDWNSTGRFISGGFGTKVFLNERFFVSPEVRIGWEPHIRVGVTLGCVLIK